MARSPFQARGGENAPFSLFVEGLGDNDTAFFLLKRYGLQNLCSVKKTMGYDKLRKAADAFLHSHYPEIEEEREFRLGIVADADDDLNARWQSLSSVLTKYGYAVPAQPDPSGTILSEPDKIRVGIWIMPDNKNSGALEDFLFSMIPGQDVLWTHAVKVVSELPRPRDFADKDVRKAEVYSWMAWQKEPDCHISTAIEARFLDADTPLAQEFIAWIRRLFEIAP